MCTVGIIFLVLFRVRLTFTNTVADNGLHQDNEGQGRSTDLWLAQSPLLHHFSWTNEADSCSLSWKVPVVKCTWERQRQCHLHIKAHYKRKTKQICEIRRTHDQRLAMVSDNAADLASSMYSKTLTRLLITAVIPKEAFLVSLILSLTCVRTNKEYWF